MATTHHGADVAAHVAVVRYALNRAADAGAPIAAVTTNGLELVERWLAGEPVSYEEIAEANRTTLDESHRAFAHDRGSTRVSSINLPSAVGNLCCFALKQPGWASAAGGAFQDAVSTVAALEKVDYGAPHEALRTRLLAMADEARRVALESAVGTRRPPKSRVEQLKGKPRRVDKDVATTLGEVAATRLVKVKARRDPTLHGTEQELRARLKELSYPFYVHLLAFEARWGGTIFAAVSAAEGDWDSLFGAFGCLGYASPGAPGGAGTSLPAGPDGLVPVARGPFDDIYYADAHGAAWACWLDRPCFAYARSLETMVARFVLWGLSLERGAKPAQVVELDGGRGEEVATTLKLPLIAEASDHLGRAWGDSRSLVLDQFGRTHVSSSTPAKLTRWR